MCGDVCFSLVDEVRYQSGGTNAINYFPPRADRAGATPVDRAREAETGESLGHPPDPPSRDPTPESAASAAERRRASRVPARI